MRRLGGTALAAVAILACAGTAQAGFGSSAPTRLKLANRPPAMHGKVLSPVPECEPNRRVKLFRERRNGSTTLLGRTNSEPDGSWRIPVDPLKSGRYYAKAKQHIVDTSAGTTVLCEPDFSPTVTVD